MSTFPVDTPYITVAQPKCWKLKYRAKVIITELASIRHECQPWVVFSRLVKSYLESVYKTDFDRILAVP